MNLTVLQDGSEQIRYNDPRIPLYVRRGDLRSLSNMAALCHWHDDVELLLCRDGYLSYKVNGVQVHVGEGDAIFVNARQMHYGYSADGSDCRYCCIAFRPQLLFGNEEIANRFVLPILTASQTPYVVLTHQNPHHRQLLDALMQIDALYQTQPEGFELLAVSAVYAFWQGFYSLVKNQIEDAAAADVHVLTVKQMLDFIRTHYHEKLTLDSIAASGGVCRTRCCQIFRIYLGRTPNDYLNSFRLEKGMELLKRTRLSVTEIAAACGYGSASYFTEMFTREKGCTPTQFRKQ